MEIIKLLENINNCKEPPVNEINALIERKKESFPVLLELIRKLSVDYKRMKLDRLDYVVACYILSQWREKKAFPYIIKLASISSEWIEQVWADAVTEGLVHFFVSTFDENGKDLGTGSGFCVAVNTIITNKHVIEGSKYIKIRFL